MVLCELSKKPAAVLQQGSALFKIPAVSAAWEDPVAYKKLMKEREEAEKSFEVWPLVLDLQRLLCAPPSSYVACFSGGHSHFPRPTESFQNEHRNSRSGADSLLLQRRPW